VLGDKAEFNLHAALELGRGTYTVLFPGPFLATKSAECATKVRRTPGKECRQLVNARRDDNPIIS
jgi:hypothetical protein